MLACDLIKSFGSGALPGLRLDLGLLKIICCSVLFLFLASVRGSDPARPYPNPFPNPEGQS